MTDDNRAMADMWECSLLDALAPPPDYELEWAIFCTHDLNETDFSDQLAPALHGGDSTDPRRRRTEAVAAFPDADATNPKVVVFACADAITYGHGLPWLGVVPVPGRRLHAKCALLRFKNEGGGRQKHRAVVMSANLTKNGLMRNREVFVAHEHFHTTRADNLVGAVAKIFKILINDLNSDHKSDLLGWATERLEKIKSAHGNHIIHSFGNDGILAQFVQRRRTPADRVVIVSPSFAGSQASVNLPALSKLIGKKTTVDVYLDEDARFSVAVQNNLKDLAKLVCYHRIVPQQTPTPESVPNAGRRLHAKLLASVRGDEVQILLGSANFTTNGLGDGKNREIMARLVDVTKAELNAFLASLGAKKLGNAPNDVLPTTREDSVQVEDLPLSAVLKSELQRRTKHVLGTLTVSWHGKWPPPKDLKLEHDEANWRWPTSSRPSDFIVTYFRMLDGCWALTASATINGNSIIRDIPISVLAPGGLWDEKREGCEEEDPEWGRLLQLLQAIKCNSKSSGNRKSTLEDANGEIIESSGVDDGVFRIPLGQRLVLLARHRKQLVDALAHEEDPEQLIHELLDGDEHGAQECAKSLVRHYITKIQADNKQHKLLNVLRNALPDFDALPRKDV